MFKVLGTALLGAGLFATAGAQRMVLPDDAGSASVATPKKPVSLDLTAIDKTVDPCTDFYAYACGNWQKQNPIPADKARWGRFDELGEYNTYSLYQLLEQAANHPTTPLQTKYGNYYAACMNTTLSNQLGIKPVLPMLATINALQDKSQLAALVGDLEAKDGQGLFYEFGPQEDQKQSTINIATLEQGGLTLPDRDYYLQDDDRMKMIRAKYVDHIVALMQLAGETQEQAQADAKSVMAIETALAKGSLPREEQRDPDNMYHVKTLAELQSLAPDYKWSAYFSPLGVQFAKVNVDEPAFFQAMNAEIAAVSMQDLKNYMRFHVVHANAGRLSDAFVDEDFKFRALLSGQQKLDPLWRRCTRATDAAMGEALGQDWVAKYYPASAKAEMADLISQLEVALGADIRYLDWMSPATKVEAQKKLAAFRQKIGYPDKWRDYSNVAIERNDRVGNAARIAVFDDRRELAKIDKPVDEKEWGMSPPTVNAYYNPAQNDINFPAGILQPPFFDPSGDAAVNFGAIGVVIGHEMTHGFDDEGAKYDDTGNVRSWWTAEDKAKFDARTGCEVKEYGAFEPVPGAKLNGKLTLGENTADNGGMRIAYAALQSEMQKPGSVKTTVDGYSPDQRFFLGFAQVWCQNAREQYSRMMVKVDPHSPGKFRVDGTVPNFDKFGQAFSCKQGTPMYPTAGTSCRVW